MLRTVAKTPHDENNDQSNFHEGDSRLKSAAEVQVQSMKQSEDNDSKSCHQGDGPVRHNRCDVEIERDR